ERAIDCLFAHAVRAVRIREVAGDEGVLCPDVFEHRADDRNVLWPDRVLANLARLIERQIEKARRRARETDGFDPTHRFRFPYDALDVLHLLNVHLPWALPFEERIDRRGEALDSRRIDETVAGGANEEVHITTHIVIEDRDIPTRLVRDRNLVLVLDQF